MKIVSCALHIFELRSRNFVLLRAHPDAGWPVNSRGVPISYLTTLQQICIGKLADSLYH
jgi:hypothetical protein